VSEWAGAVWAAGGPVAPEFDPVFGQSYPQGIGGTPGYPPDVERDRLAPPPPVGAYERSLFAHGPVSVLVVLPDGRHIGETPAGGFINHLRGEAEMFKRAAAVSFDWWTFLPATGYRVEINAHDAGALQVVVGDNGFEIDDLRPGELLAFSVSPDGLPGPVTRTGGEAVPVSAPEPGSVPAEGEPGSDETPAEPVSDLGDSAWLAVGFACLVVIGLALMVASGIGLARRGTLR
jgi:hypothetical protein